MQFCESTGPKGLGFSIACRLPDDTDVYPNSEIIPSAGPLRIYVRELLADGVAAVDGRYDVILSSMQMNYLYWHTENLRNGVIQKYMSQKTTKYYGSSQR